MVKCERTYPAPQSLSKKQSYNEPDTIAQLKEIFNGKCYICEMNNLQDGVPEHLISHKGNINLKFDWENLFWSCNRCNLIKNADKYDNKIIDCCKENPEKHLLCIYEPYSGNIQVRARDLEEKSKMTAQLVEAVFNFENTGLRVSSRAERMRQFKFEWNNFFKVLEAYRKNKNTFNFNKVKARLNKKTAFAAFKRDYIRTHQSEFKEFQKFVEVN